LPVFDSSVFQSKLELNSGNLQALAWSDGHCTLVHNQGEPSGQIMSSKSNSVFDFFLFNVNCPFLGCFAFDVGVKGWKFGSNSAVLFSIITSCPSKAFT